MRWDPKTGALSDGPSPSGQPSVASKIPASVLAKGQIPMLKPDGTAVLVQADQLSKASEMGYEYEPPEAEARRKEAAEYDNPLAAGALGAARGASLGLTDVGAAALGFGDEVAKYREYNPISSTVGEIGGTVIPAVASGGTGLAAKVLAKTPAALVTKAGSAVTGTLAKRIIAESVLKKAAVAGAGAAIEGTIVGAGQGLSELALSDEELKPSSIADTLISHVGAGALIGAGTGFGLSLGMSGVSGSANRIKKLFAKSDEAAAPVIDIGAAAGEATTQGTMRAGVQAEGRTVFDVTTGNIRQADDAVSGAVRGAKATGDDLDSLIRRDDEALAAGEITEMPSSKRLKEAVAELGADLRERPTNITYQMLDDPMKADILKAQLQVLPGKPREAFQGHLRRLERNLDEIQGSTLGGLGGRPRMSVVDSAEDAMSFVKTTHETTKKEAGALFEVINKTRVPTKAHMPDLINEIASGAPNVAQALSVDGATGKLLLAEFSPKLGLSSAEHSAMKLVVKDLNSPKLTVREMGRIREFLRTVVDPSNPAATPNVGAVRKAMLNHIERLVEAYNPEAKVREAFTKYAKNEAFIEGFEDLIGGKIESFDAAYRASPEKFFDKVFANSSNALKARGILGEERFSAIMGDYLQGLVKKATDEAKGTVSGAALSKLLKAKEPVISQVGGEAVLRRLNAINDIRKSVVQAAPVNPSGTAKTGLITSVLRGGKQAVNLQFGEALSSLAGGLDAKIQARSAYISVNRVLRGAEVVVEATKESNKRISKALGTFIKTAETTGKAFKSAAVPTGITVRNFNEQRKLIDTLSTYGASPEKLAEDIGMNTEGLNDLDENVHQEVTSRMVAAIAFLQTKAPKNPGQRSIFGDEPYRPSDAEVAKFHRYVRAVDDPMSILEDFNSRVLTSEGVEAVSTLYPDLYKRITDQTIEKVSAHRGRIPFQDKMQLSILLGMPVSSAADPAFVQKMQQTFGPPGADEETAGGGAQPRPAGMENINRATSSQSDVERLMNRKGN